MSAAMSKSYKGIILRKENHDRTRFPGFIARRKTGSVTGCRHLYLESHALDLICKTFGSEKLIIADLRLLMDLQSDLLICLAVCLYIIHNFLL